MLFASCSQPSGGSPNGDGITNGGSDGSGSGGSGSGSSGSGTPTTSDIVNGGMPYNVTIDGKNYVFTFASNGTGTVKEAASSNTRAIITVEIGTGGTSFTWTLSGNIVTIRIDGNVPFTLTYKKSGNTKTLSNPKLVNPLDSDDDDDSGESGDLPKATYTWDEDTKTITFTGPGEVTSDWIFDGNNRQYVVKKAIIEDGVTSIGAYAFSACGNLTSVTIPDGVTSIGEFAFNACTNLASVTIGNGVTSIGAYAFSACGNLTSVTIPDGVEEIGRAAFYGCTKLSSVTIGNGVQNIGAYAFSACGNLTSVTITALEPPFIGSTSVHYIYITGVVYVPADSVDKYKTSQWSTCQIKPITE